MEQPVLRENGLVIRIQNNHMLVTDGCQLDSVESNILDDERRKKDDYTARATNQIARRYLWAGNVVVAKFFYDSNRKFNLKCPSCNKRYSLVREDFIPAVEEYRRLDL